MPIKVTCQKCGGVLHAPDDSGGKRGKCPTCGNILNIPADGPRSAGVPVSTSPPPPPADHPFREPVGPAPVKSKMTGAIGFADVAESPKVPAPAVRPPEPRPVPTRGDLRPAPLPGRDDEPLDVAAAGWRRVKRGFGWLRASVVFLALALIAPAAVWVVDLKAPGTIPDKSPGFLGIEGLRSFKEVFVGAWLVPAALGTFCGLLGLMGVAGAPRSSFARGLARMAFLAGLAATAGLVAAIVPFGKQLAAKQVPTHLASPADLDGQLQRCGLAVALAGSVAAKLWLIVAVGKIGASLHQGPASARSGRLVFLTGALAAAAVVAAVGYRYYPAEMTAWWADTVAARWDQVNPADKPVARAGAVIAAALVGGLVYLRLVGAGRRAAREWLAQHPGR